MLDIVLALTFGTKSENLSIMKQFYKITKGQRMISPYLSVIPIGFFYLFLRSIFGFLILLSPLSLVEFS